MQENMDPRRQLNPQLKLHCLSSFCYWSEFLELIRVTKNGQCGEEEGGMICIFLALLDTNNGKCEGRGGGVNDPFVELCSPYVDQS